MPQAVINIRMDEDLKRSFSAVCDELGLSMSTAITVFAKKVARENRIPFELSIDPFYSKSNTEHLAESLMQLEQGLTVQKSLDELRKYE